MISQSNYELKDKKMSRVCEITKKKPMSGHNVSHSEIKTKRRFLPKIHFPFFAYYCLPEYVYSILQTAFKLGLFCFKPSVINCLMVSFGILQSCGMVKSNIKFI